MASTQENARNSPLLLLPAELCKGIYEAVFISSTVGVKLKETPTRFRGATALLLACSQIHHEALTLYWTTATFDVSFHCSRRLADKVFGYDKSLLVTSVMIRTLDANFMVPEWAQRRTGPSYTRLLASDARGPYFMVQEKDVFPALRRVHVQQNVISPSKHSWQYAELLLNVRSNFGIDDLEVTVDEACEISGETEGV